MGGKDLALLTSSLEQMKLDADPKVVWMNSWLFGWPLAASHWLSYQQ